MSLATSAAETSKLRVLLHVHELHRTSSADATLEALAETLSSETAPLSISLTDALELLALDGYVYLDRRLGNMIAGARPSATGRERAAKFDAARNSALEKRRRLRDDYLYWLYEQIEEKDGGPTPDDYLASSPSYLGIPYTAKDIEKAGEWLVESGFIQGAAAWQYSGPLRPNLTKKGSFTVESSHSTARPLPSGGDTYTTTVHGPAVVAQGNSQITQTTNVHLVIEGNKLLDGVQEALQSLPEEIRDPVSRAKEEARDALQGNPDIGRLKKALGVMAGFLSQTTSGALGGILSTQILAFLGSLP